MALSKSPAEYKILELSYKFFTNLPSNLERDRTIDWDWEEIGLMIGKIIEV